MYKKKSINLLLFSFAPFLSALASLIAIPTIAHHFGATAWAAIAIGLSIGVGASVFVELGWGLDGPSKVASQSSFTRRITFALAITSKMLVLPIAMLGAITLVLLIVREYTFVAVLSTVSAVLLGLNSNWYFIGTKAPGWIILGDALPRAICAFIAALLISKGAMLWTYPAFLIFGSALNPFISFWIVSKNNVKKIRRISLSLSLKVVRSQVTALRGRVASSIYLAAPTAILGIVSPGSVATFAGIDRLQRMYLTFLQIFPNSMIGQVSEQRDNKIRVKRLKLALLFNGVIAIVAAPCWIILLNPAISVIFANTINITANQVFLSSGIIFLTVLSRATGYIGLIALGGVKHVSNSASAGAIFGIVAITYLGFTNGAEGALLALCMSELVVLTWQFFYLIRALIGFTNNDIALSSLEGLK